MLTLSKKSLALIMLAGFVSLPSITLAARVCPKTIEAVNDQLQALPQELLPKFDQGHVFATPKQYTHHYVGTGAFS